LTVVERLPDDLMELAAIAYRNMRKQENLTAKPSRNIQRSQPLL
jgi:hypothetical protein